MRSKVVPQTKETVISNSSGLWPSRTPPITLRESLGPRLGMAWELLLLTLLGK